MRIKIIFTLIFVFCFQNFSAQDFGKDSLYVTHLIQQNNPSDVLRENLKYNEIFDNLGVLAYIPYRFIDFKGVKTIELSTDSLFNKYDPNRISFTPDGLIDSTSYTIGSKRIVDFRLHYTANGLFHQDIIGHRYAYSGDTLISYSQNYNQIQIVRYILENKVFITLDYLSLDYKNRISEKEEISKVQHNGDGSILIIKKTMNLALSDCSCNCQYYSNTTWTMPMSIDNIQYSLVNEKGLTYILQNECDDDPKYDRRIRYYLNEKGELIYSTGFGQDKSKRIYYRYFYY